MNRRFTARAFVALVITATGCADATGPKPITVSAPLLQSAEACYAVSGTIVESFQSADLVNGIFYFGGPVTGDLVGTSLSGLTASTIPAGDPPSPIGFGAGTSTITVAGGTVTALIGAVLVFELEQVSRTIPPLVTTNQRMTLLSGARRGSLTSHGTFDFSTFTSSATYRGSICP